MRLEICLDKRKKSNKNEYDYFLSSSKIPNANHVVFLDNLQFG